MTIKYYLRTLNEVYDGKPWYGKSVLKILSSVNENVLNAKYVEGHSVAQILEHMITWRHWAMQMFEGNYGYRIEIDSNDDWEKHKEYGAEDVTGLLEKLAKNQAAILAILSSKDDDWLKEMIPERKFKFEDAVRGVIQHDIYHLGLIAMLLKK